MVIPITNKNSTSQEGFQNIRTKVDSIKDQTVDATSLQIRGEGD